MKYEKLEKLADKGSIRTSIGEASNPDVGHVYFTVNGVPVSAQFDIDGDGLYGTAITLEDLFAIAGKEEQ